MAVLGACQIGSDGKPTHTHVYKKAPNGNGVIAGHAVDLPAAMAS